jgi:hypothetical protein
MYTGREEIILLNFIYHFGEPQEGRPLGGLLGGFGFSQTAKVG